MNEDSIYEALGVTRTGDGGKEQEVAGPAPDGNMTQQAGEDAEAQETTGAAPEEPPPESGSGAAPGEGSDEEASGRISGDSRMEQSEVSSDEEKRARADAAARRRRAETQAAIDRALDAQREQHQAEMAAFFQAAGLKNTLTGAPITNMDEFRDWKQAFDAARLQQDLKEGTLTPETLEQAISSSPSMQKMKELLERDEAARRESDAAAAQVKIDAELREIHKLDPSINTTEDLLNMPAAKEFYEYVRRGNTFLDAYYLANRQKLTQAAAEAARQQAMNAARSKDHLQPSGTARGVGAASVPTEELELFKLLNPEATEGEIQAYYNKTKSRQ